VTAAAVEEKEKYGSPAVSAALNDPDLNFSRADVDLLKKAQDILPPPIEMLKGSKKALKCDKNGIFNFEIKKKLRKMDFGKLKDKQITVTKEHLLMLNKETQRLKGRLLQAVDEPKEDAKQKFMDSECDLSPESLMKECQFTYEI